MTIAIIFTACAVLAIPIAFIYFYLEVIKEEDRLERIEQNRKNLRE